MSDIQPIPQAVKDAFHDIVEGNEKISLISCVYRGQPNWVIAMVEERADGSGFEVTPLFMTMTPEMFDQTENPAPALRAKLAEANGNEEITDKEAKQLLEKVEQMFRVQ